MYRKIIAKIITLISLRGIYILQKKNFVDYVYAPIACKQKLKSFSSKYPRKAVIDSQWHNLPVVELLCSGQFAF